LRFEAYPTWFTRTIDGYSGLLPENTLARESWAQVQIDGQPAGFVHNLYVLDDDGPVPIQEISTRMQMRVRILKQTQNIRIHSKIQLDRDYAPTYFHVTAATESFSIRVSGERIQKQRYAISMQSGENHTERTITIPDHAVLYNPIYESVLKDMKPGKALSIETLDPLTLETVKIVIKAGDAEIIESEGQNIKAIPLMSRWRGMEFRSWVDKDGNFIKQETPLGWTIVAATQEEAMQAIAEDHPAPSLIGNSLQGLNVLRMLTINVNNENQENND
jgi:hypothetical protein